jgi:sulfite exporter TauE/SafE
VDVFLPMLGLGFATSFHCVAMCGALVLTYAVKDGPGEGLVRRLIPNLVYQGAKITSYVVVGLLLGAIGAAFDLAGIRGWVMLAAGLFMVLLGLNMSGWFPLLRRLTLRPPKALTAALARNRRKAKAEAEAGHMSMATPLLFGALTGFMPCGPLQAAQLSAASAGSAVSGAVTMLGFGLGTAPLMLAFGLGSGYLGSALRRRMNLVAAVVIIVLGLVMFDRGSMLVGSPLTFQSARQVLAGAPAPEQGGFREGADGIAEVDLVIENVRFVPETLSIPADRPVRLVVDRREANTCSEQLAIPQLGVLVTLTPFATTVVELPATQQGTYTLTCGMGMMSGRLVVGDSSAGLAGSPLVGLVLGGSLLVLAGYVVSIRKRRSVAVCPAPRSRTASAPPTFFLGFTATELLVIAAVLLSVVIAGILLGGGLG